MSQTIVIDPITRIEGHLKVEITVDGGTVTNAKVSGTMFRGIEMILQGRAPLDATQYTQRICGVCPISHGLASAMAIENACAISAPDNGRILRNLILGSNFIQSHILHFYHLALLDYIDTTGILDTAPWTPRFNGEDMIGGTTASQLVKNYIEALTFRRKAHQMAAIFGGKLPCCATIVAGGCTESPTTENISQFRLLLDEHRKFIEEKFIPDVGTLAKLFPQYYEIGKGKGNLLAYGVFDLDSQGQNKLFARGHCVNGGNIEPVDGSKIVEYVGFSKYDGICGNKHPSQGETLPQATKPDAYSWIKAPRYNGNVYEVGPLARLWINGDYRRGVSVMDRLMARALEAQKIASAMNTWLNEIAIGGAVYKKPTIPAQASGFALVEAPRGALGHWIAIDNQKIGKYQIVTPTCWNASPADETGQKGAMEQAIVGTTVNDIQQPLEVLRVIHSFDPCLACSVHVIHAGCVTGVSPSIAQAAIL